MTVSAAELQYIRFAADADMQEDFADDCRKTAKLLLCYCIAF